jgi:hypothetical protein
MGVSDVQKTGDCIDAFKDASSCTSMSSIFAANGTSTHSSNDANEVIALRPSKAGGDGVIVFGGVPKKAIKAASSNTCACVDVGVLLGVRGIVSPHGYDVSTLRQSKRSVSVRGMIVTEGGGDGGGDGVAASMIMYVS